MRLAVPAPGNDKQARELSVFFLGRDEAQSRHPRATALQLFGARPSPHVIEVFLLSAYGRPDLFARGSAGEGAHPAIGVARFPRLALQCARTASWLAPRADLNGGTGESGTA